MSHRALVTGLCLLAGCGSGPGNSMDAGTDSGVPMPTMLTATGALTGMITAPKPTAGTDAVTNTSFFNLRKTSGTGLAFKIDVTIDFGGAPTAQTYDSSSAGFRCNATVTDGMTAANTWIALFNSMAGGDTGTCSLTLTSATMSASGYDVAGTLSITGTASGGGAGGMVTVMGTF